MTDQQTLFTYRMSEAEETLTDARAMLAAGIIALFDRHFVHTGRLGRDYSKILHRAFDSRQEADYRELVIYTVDDARECLRMAERFLLGIKELITAGEPS